MKKEKIFFCTQKDPLWFNIFRIKLTCVPYFCLPPFLSYAIPPVIPSLIYESGVSKKQAITRGKDIIIEFTFVFLLLYWDAFHCINTIKKFMKRKLYGNKNPQQFYVLQCNLSWFCDFLFLKQ